MSRRNVLSLSLLCLGLLALKSVAAPEASVSPVQAEAMFTQMVQAIEQDDRGAFLENGSSDFRDTLTRRLFDGVVTEFAPRLKRGYSVDFLGKLNQVGSDVYLFKLSFSDGSDDVLAKLVITGTRVGGFWLQ